jgi:purine-nucleoside phosphorylase
MQTMERDIHLKPQDLLASLQFKPGDFGSIALVSGQAHRAKMCLEKLENPVKNFTFLGYTFWTGLYKGKKITVGNGGFYAPDSAFVTELLCVGGVDNLIRLGSCGALRKDISIGDYILATNIVRGDGATRYYVDDNFSPKVDEGLTKVLEQVFSQAGKVHRGGVWSTDALFRETRDIVNSYIEKGATAVDMVTSPFITLANIYNKKAAAILAVSDNLITGQLGFADFRFFEAEMKMSDLAFGVVDNLMKE